MVLLDDSIVRGTQLKDNIVKLTEVGVFAGRCISESPVRR